MKKRKKKLTKRPLFVVPEERGPLWNWLHDDLRKDELMGAMKKRHKHIFNRSVTIYIEDGTSVVHHNIVCSCGEIRR